MKDDKILYHHSLWDYACEVYGKPDVQRASLQLQEEEGANIPLLLFCCWVAGRFGGLTSDQAEHIAPIASLWTETCIRPLRKVRQNMKQLETDKQPEAWQSLREQVKAIELGAEKQLIQALEQAMLSQPISNEAIYTASSKDLTVVNNSLFNIKQVGLGCVLKKEQALAAIVVILHAAHPEIEYHALFEMVQTNKIKS